MGHALKNVLRGKIGRQTAPVPHSTALGINSKDGHCVWRLCPNNLERIGDKCDCKIPAVEVREDPCGDSKCFTPQCPRGEVRQTHGTCVNFCKDGYILVKGVCICHLPHEKTICGDGERLDSNIDECVCKDGLTREHPDYTCKPPKPLGGPAKCPSGIQTGNLLCSYLLGGYVKCQQKYRKMLQLHLPQRPTTWLQSQVRILHSVKHANLFGKFSLCITIECAPNLPIEAGTSFDINDLIQGDLGQGRRSWLSNDSDGAYITRTPQLEEAADFVIVKWPGGKHCLGGLENGVGLIKTDDGGSVGATMLTRDDQSCVLVTVTEVPCDIRAETANCFGGNKTETSVSSPAASKVANASMPIDGSGVSGHH